VRTCLGRFHDDWMLAGVWCRHQNDRTFTSLVARKFGLRAANFGVSGYGGVGSLFRLREHLDQHPKVVIYGFWEDHLNRNVRRCAQIDAPLCLEMGRVAFDKNGIPHITPEHSEQSFELSRSYYRQTTSDSDRWRTLWTDIFWTGMRTWQETRRITATKFVLGIPAYFGPVVIDAPAELESFARESGITWVSLTKRFNDLKREGREFTIPKRRPSQCTRPRCRRGRERKLVVFYPVLRDSWRN
jgi:hypothetical protein